MKYKDIMGYTKKQPKKKVVKEKLSPKKTILDGIKQELNEWHHQPPSTKRWSKKFNGSQGLTEFEKKGGKDFVNETLPAFPKEWKKLEKTEIDFLTAINRLGLSVGKIDREYNREVSLLFKKYLGKNLMKFKEAIKDLLGKLQ